MDQNKNSEFLFTSPKNTTQVYPDDTNNIDERDTLKPKSNKHFLQLPTRKKNFFFQSMKNLSQPKDQQNQNQKQVQRQQSIDGQNNKPKQNTIINQSLIVNVTKNTDTDKNNAIPQNNQPVIPAVINIKKNIKQQEEKSNSPMHLSPFMIYPSSINNNRRNSLVNVSVQSGEKSKRRISNFQKSLFQKKMKMDEEYEGGGGGGNALNDYLFEQNINGRKSFGGAINSEEGNRMYSSQGVASAVGVVQGIPSGDSEISHISSIMHKGRIFSNSRRLTEYNSSNYNPSKKSSSSTKRKWNFVKKLGIVRKFIEKLQAQSSVYLFSRLTKEHVATINDKAYILGDEDNISIFGLLIKIIASYFEQKSWLQPISPESEIIIYTSLFFLCAYTFLIYSIPVYVVFSFEGDFSDELIARIIPIIIVIFDIFIKCNTSYYKQGNIVTSRKKIFKNYFKSYIFYDILILVCLAATRLSTIFHLAILLKLRDLIAIEENIHQKFFISQNIQPQYTLIKLIYFDLFLAHMFSCGFIFVAKIGLESQNWISENQLHDSHWIEQYVTSLYFSIITMTTVGFGDIHPYNNIEKIYVSVVTMISSGIFGYTLSVIGGIMHEKFQKEAEYKRKKYDLNHYMSMRSIGKSIQLKALKYLDYVKHKDDQQPLRGQDIVYHLSDDLQKLIKRDFYGSILNQYKILNFNFSPQCLADLALRMQESYFGPGEIIYTQNNLDDRLFFVAKGRVELFTESNIQYTYEIIQKGQAFGKDSFFGQPLLYTSAKSVSFSLIVFCSSLDFKDVLMNYPEDYEKFCMMRDNLTVNSKPFQNSCTICKKLYHTIINCPLMHHVRKKEFIVHKYIHSEPMERQTKERRKYEKFNALKELTITKKYLKKIRTNMIKVAKEKKLNHKINSFSSTSSSSISSYSSDENIKGKPLGTSMDKDDRQFYMRNPKIACVDGSIQVNSTYSDILSDSLSLSEYNNYFQNLEQVNQIIKVNGVETIQEEKSVNNFDDDPSASYAYQRIRRRSALPNHKYQQLFSPQYQEDLEDKFDKNFQFKDVSDLIQAEQIINQKIENSQDPQIKNDNTMFSNKPVIGSNPKLESPMNGNKNKQQFEQSPSEIVRALQKKDSLAHLQQQEGSEEDLAYNRQASHKEPLLNRSTTPVQGEKIFNKQLSVRNVSNPSKFYKKESSLRQPTTQQGSSSLFPNSHAQQTILQSSQFSLSSINDLNQSPQNRVNDSSKMLSPATQQNNTKLFFSSRPISSNVYENSQQNQIVSGFTAYQQQNIQEPQPNTQKLQLGQANNLFGVHNFKKPFLDKPARMDIKKLTMMNDFNTSDFETYQPSKVAYTNPYIAQIQATAQLEQQARRESHLSINFNNMTQISNSRRATLQNNPQNMSFVNMTHKTNQINNANEEQPQKRNTLLIKNIQIYSPKNSGSGGQNGGNSLTIPGTPIAGFNQNQQHRLSINRDMSLLMKNVSPLHALSSPMQSNIPMFGGSSEENNILNYSQLFIPLDLDTIKEYKKYFPEGNFSSQFKEKIKIMKLLSRKLSNNTKDNPSLKKILHKKLSKLQSISQKRSFLKQNSKFSGLSMQNNLNALEFPHIKSQNITPNVSINGLQ